MFIGSCEQLIICSQEKTNFYFSMWMSKSDLLVRMFHSMSLLSPLQGGS